METRTLRIGTSIVVAVATALLLFACSGVGPGDQTEDGTISLSLTDAPLDDTDVTGVYITISEIQYGGDETGWTTMEEFDPEANNPYNLLDLTGGTSTLLGELSLPSGTYSQIRFVLDAPERGQETPSNPGTYIEYTDGSTALLFVPSGAERGYAAVSEESFTVPSNGSVSLTADFDARRSVVEAGASGIIILKPTLRLLVDDQAGEITGTLTNMDGSTRYTVLAYEDDTYDSTEADDPAVEESRFPTAVSSFTPVDEDDDGATDGSADYTIAYLAAGTYDLYIAKYTDDNGDGAFEFSGEAPLTGPQNLEVTASYSTTAADTDVSL